MKCPLCETEVHTEVQPVPKWYVGEISEKVLHVQRHDPCRNYWIRATATGDVEAEQKAIFADLGADERAFLAHATQRTRDCGGGFIIDAAWSRNLIDSLACAREIALGFGLGAAKVEHGGGFDGWNPLLFLTAEDGKRFTIRVHSAGTHVDEVRSKVYWLRTLRREADVEVPDPVVGSDGEPIQWVDPPGEGDPRYCLLYRWIDGRMLADVEEEHRTEALISNVGVQLAKMHRHAKRYTLPTWFCRPRYGLEEFHQFVAGCTVSDEKRPEVERVAAQMASAMEQLGEGRDAFGLIHVENGAGNVLARGDEVAFIDFRRFGWGHYMTDIQKMAHFVKQEERARLLAGYASVLPLPPRFDQHFAAFDEVRRVIGHFT